MVNITQKLSLHFETPCFEISEIHFYQHIEEMLQKASRHRRDESPSLTPTTT